MRTRVQLNAEISAKKCAKIYANVNCINPCKYQYVVFIGKPAFEATTKGVKAVKPSFCAYGVVKSILQTVRTHTYILFHARTLSGKCLLS